MFEIPLSFPIMAITSTKEDTLQFYEKVVGEQLLNLVIKNNDLDKNIEKARKEATVRLGKMPPVEIVDISWAETDISDVLN